MSDPKIAEEEALVDQLAPEADDDKNERSTIAFPYLDLEAAEEVAKAIWSRTASSPCPVDELAAALGMTVSGAFRMKTATARVFGVVEKDGRSAFRLSPLGLRLVSPGSEPGARVDAFLAVPLYNKIYDSYRGRLLPPAKALEREMQTFGVSSKQTDKARQAFERSARKAGFYEAGDDRLVRPKVAENNGQEPPPTAEAPASAPPRPAPPSQTDDRLALIKQLVSYLPEQLTNEKLAQWLRAAEMNLRFSHNVEGEIKIEIVRPSQ